MYMSGSFVDIVKYFYKYYFKYFYTLLTQICFQMELNVMRTLKDHYMPISFL